MRRTSSLVAWITGVGGVLLVAYNLLSAYTAILGFSSPTILKLFGTPFAWLLLFACFCTLWWQMRHSETPPVDGVVYREVIKLRQENDALRRLVGEVAPRQLTEQQRDVIRARLVPALKKLGRGPQISIFWTGSGDTAGYAKQFEELLEAIGFSMLRVSGPGTYMLDHDYHYGLWVRYDSRPARENGLPVVGEILVSALKETGVRDVIEFDLEGHHLLEMIVGAPYRTEADAERQRQRKYLEGRTR